MRTAPLLAGLLCLPLLAGCGAGTTGGGVPDPAAVSRAELLQSGAEVVDICIRFMPDAQAFQDALIARGFQFEGISDDFRIISGANRHVLAVASTSSARSAACGVALDGMTVAEAVTLAGPMIRAARAVQIPPDNLSGNLGPVWDGEFKKAPVRIAVSEDMHMHFFSGKILMAVENK